MRRFRLGLAVRVAVVMLSSQMGVSVAAPPPTVVAPPKTKINTTDKVESRNQSGAAPTETKPATPAQLARGVVVLQKEQRGCGYGIVLNGDGRILASLSAIGNGVGLRAVYADGSSQRLRVAHVDRGWDLALLSPMERRWLEGLRAAHTSEIATPVTPLRLLRSKAPMLSLPSGTVSRQSVTGVDNVALADALVFKQKLTSNERGAPVLDSSGDVLAIITQGCGVSPGNCSPMLIGVPVEAIKAFLRKVPPGAVRPAPWLGLKVASVSGSVVPVAKIVEVVPRSPAAALGVHPGTQGNESWLVAVDGVSVNSPEALSSLLEQHSVGDTVTLLIFSEGRYHEVFVSLTAGVPAPSGLTAPQSSAPGY